jgi:tetraacyldisaccharide 4'-kinase
MKRPWLAPLVPLYAAGLALRNLRLRRGWERTRDLWYPVVSIGNLSVGGTGKTPFVIALARLLMSRGFQVDVLSRGYGRESHEPVRVDPTGTAEQYGDEALLIACEGAVPVYVASQRYDAGVLADRAFIKEGGQLSGDRVPLIHLLDDGFQHRQLLREIDIVLLDRNDWTDHLLPAGNLRETLNAAKRADVIAIPAGDSELEQELVAWGWRGSLWRLHRCMNVPLIDGSVVAFCGIARPGQFFAGLKAAGLELANRTTFRDHHRYTIRDVERLLATARSSGAKALVTTQKDAVRLAPMVSAFPAGLPLKIADLKIEIENERECLDWLEKKLAMTHLVRAHRKAIERSANSQP